jgi:hypothetical protein
LIFQIFESEVLMGLTEKEEAIVAGYIGRFFGSAKVEDQVTPIERDTVAEILKYVGKRFTRMKYILGLALDFVVLAQRLSAADPDFKPLSKQAASLSQIFERYELVEKRGSQKANTLTLRYEDADFGIRHNEEQTVAAFHSMGRTNYPSSAPYTTGQWHKYEELLILAFQLTRAGRLSAVRLLFEFGLAKLERSIFFVRPPQPRLFDEVLKEYSWSGESENAGLTFQAMAFGFLSSDRGHLDIVSDKVRTGSARQKRFGDIDCYLGLHLELSAEVKGGDIKKTNFSRELGPFCSKVKEHKIYAIVFAKSFDGWSLKKLEEDKILGLSEEEMKRQVARWDWPKQDRALAGMLHYIAHIEQNPKAVSRLLGFIETRDPKHSSLALHDLKSLS